MSKKTTKTTTALAERERLLAEAEHARSTRDDHAVRGREIAQELKRITRERREALRLQARTGAAAGVDEFNRRESELRAEEARVKVAAKAAAEAAQAAQKELPRLHHDRFGEFAEAAEELSGTAAERLAALRDAYVAAHAAIEASRREWTRLARDHNSEINRRSNPAERASGTVRQRQLSPPPENPLRSPVEVFSAPPIRPVEIEPLEVEAAA